MTDEEARYERLAAGYERWWAPVLRPSALRLLDRLADRLDQAAAVLDVGAGTGTLTLEALRRWPTLRMTAVDASGEMLSGLEASLGDDERRNRYEGWVADAATLPFDDETFDAAVSSFVLQLVPSRAAALREIRRVLRPGGTIGYVTWQVDRRPFAPDRLFDALLAEFGYEDEPPEPRCGDVPGPARAVGELRAAGYRHAWSEGGMLEFAFTVDSYIGFLTQFDEQTLFEDMGRSERHRFLARLRDGLARLPDEDLVLRSAIVYASGTRSER